MLWQFVPFPQQWFLHCHLVLDKAITGHPSASGFRALPWTSLTAHTWQRTLQIWWLLFLGRCNGALKYNIWHMDTYGDMFTRYFKLWSFNPLFNFCEIFQTMGCVQKWGHLRSPKTGPMNLRRIKATPQTMRPSEISEEQGAIRSTQLKKSWIQQINLEMRLEIMF